MEVPSPADGPLGGVLALLGAPDLLSLDPLVRLAADHGALIAFAIAPDGEILRVHGPVPDAITDARGDTEGQNVFELYADVPELLGAVARALRGVAVRATLTIDGAVLDCHYVPVCDADGAVAGLRGVAFPLDGSPQPLAVPARAPIYTMDEAGLSPRERAVVRLLAQRVPRADIADRLFITAKTVTTYLGRARGKIAEALGIEIDSTTALVAFAVRHGWDRDRVDGRSGDSECESGAAERRPSRS